MSDIIQLLPDHVANQIAAGEVVQRPASVVKELLENAIDANANDIKLLVKDAGRTLIQVIDNGMGMSSNDAIKCFDRHATSKIKDAKDLFELQSKGFRGEALASIAAVAHVSLRTRKESDELGKEITIAGSEISKEEVVATPVGTSIAVKNLFFNIPARRNFLKSNNVEIKHIMEEFQRVALAHPDLCFSMYNNDNEVFHLEAGNLKQRIVAIFGKKMDERLVPINEQTDIISATGYITKSDFVKKRRGEQFFFVNQRFIKNGYLHHAILNAYEGLIPSGTHPSYFLFLEIPPDTIDINIHPTKTEIKFENEKAIYAIIRSTVKHSLGQYNVAPVLDFNRDASLDIPYDYQKKKTHSPTIEVDRSFNPFEAETKITSSSSSSPKTSSFGGFARPTNTKKEAWEELYVNLESDTAKVVHETPNEVEITIESEPQQVESNLFEEDIDTGKTIQIQKKYILSTIKSGMVYIHQQRAHARILYEDFLEKVQQQERASQQLLFPLQWQVNAMDKALIVEVIPTLEGLGFSFGATTDNGIEVTGVPTEIPESKGLETLEDILLGLQEDIPKENSHLHHIIAATMASTLCIKTGKKLDLIEQEDILNKLFICAEPTISPFGKPTFVSVDIDEINKKF